ncbi:MAG: hypothetical protein OXL33_00445 [Chloroflexota bacterium]|nr:hypothetical protein [Chloroflexota bacterium]
MESQYRYRGLVCNIGPGERRQRLIFGVVLIQLSIVAWALMLAFGLDQLWRLSLQVPLWLGLMGIGQAHYQICVGFDFVGKVDPAVAGEVGGHYSPGFWRGLRLRSLKLLAGTGAGAALLTALAYAIG